MFDGIDGRAMAVNGTTLFVRTGGRPDGPPLLLLHGYPETHVMWHRVAQQLAGHYCLVMPDLRGYGRSAKPAGASDHANYSKRAMAADVLGLMRALGHERFFVAGHDRGGRVAHRLALDHPGAVAKLCVIDIAPTLTMYERTDMAFATAYYHWFYLIQPQPLPERQIGGGGGRGGPRFRRARGAGRLRSRLLHARGRPRRLRGLPRGGFHRPGTRPCLACGGAARGLRPACAVGRARRGGAAVPAAGRLARRLRRRGHRPRRRGGPFHPRRAAAADGQRAGGLLRYGRRGAVRSAAVGCCLAHAGAPAKHSVAVMRVAPESWDWSTRASLPRIATHPMKRILAEESAC